MTGHWLRLNKLFSEGKRAVVIAADHGQFQGPQEGMVDLPAAVAALEEADAIQLSVGMVSHCGAVFGRRGAPLAVARLNWSSVFCQQWNFHRGVAVAVATPQEALAAGADICLASLTLTGLDEERDAHNVEVFARIAAQKRECGIPLIGEFYPPTPGRLTLEELHERLAVGCRIMAELGADVVKTFYTGERFRELVEACPVPILAQGAERLETPEAALQFAHEAARAGARGVALGRPVLQAPDPALLVQGLRRVLKEDADPQEVATELGLAQ
jgi:DhnA family fructose-bisphosphate aldolase class Ia